MQNKETIWNGLNHHDLSHSGISPNGLSTVTSLVASSMTRIKDQQYLKY